jgi:hypothetical protein
LLKGLFGLGQLLLEGGQLGGGGLEGLIKIIVLLFGLFEVFFMISLVVHLVRLSFGLFIAVVRSWW